MWKRSTIAIVLLPLIPVLIAAMTIPRAVGTGYTGITYEPTLSENRLSQLRRLVRATEGTAVIEEGSPNQSIWVFFSAGCPHCLSKLPDWIDMKEGGEDLGVSVLFVSVDRQFRHAPRVVQLLAGGILIDQRGRLHASLSDGRVPWYLIIGGSAYRYAADRGVGDLPGSDRR